MMKSHHVWIFLLISISTFIAATSNETLSSRVDATANLPLSSTPASTSTNKNSSPKDTTSAEMSFMLMNGNKNSTSSNMSLPSTITTPQTAILYPQSTTTSFAVSTTSSHYVNYRRSNSNVERVHPRNSLMLLNGATLSSKKRRSPDEKALVKPECEQFTIGDENSRTFYSPGFPGDYTKNTSCVKVIEAKVGFQLRLDFRDFFHIEPSDGCKFDYLEIHDGAHGFSEKIGKYCGHNFPDTIDSKGRFLWLHFHSDENIEHQGFKAVYDFVPRPTSGVYDDTPCGETISAYDGWINTSNIDKEKIEYVKKHKLPLDCMWVIQVEQDWKIQISFIHFKLSKPNDCESNSVDVFGENTDLPSRIKHFCGSIADSATTPSNVAHIRYFAEADAVESEVNILFTAFRSKSTKNKDEPCRPDEYDCEDQTCIKGELRCNGEINCRFRWDEDEDKCKGKVNEDEQMYIILTVFGVMVSIMVIAFAFNCVRKIMRDHKIIREHIRQSRESKLDEIERHSTKMTKSRENIAMHQLTKLPPPAFDLDPMTSINGGNNNTTNNQFYRDEKETSRSIHEDMRKSESRNDLDMREREIKHIFGSSYHQDDDNEYKDNSEMCDTGCQTRESLFQPVFSSRSKHSQSPMHAGMRFSTFGHLESTTPSPPPPPSASHCPTHSMRQLSMSHQHSHHHHYHHLHSSTNPMSMSDDMDSNMGTIGTINSKEKAKKFLLKKDEAALMTSARSAASDKTTIPIEDVISVVKQTTTSPRHSASLAKSQPVLDATSTSINNSFGSISSINVTAEDYKTITVNYAKRLIDQRTSPDDGTNVSDKGGASNGDVNKWRIQSITLFNNDKLIVREWYETLTKILDALHRPRKLLLFVNPYGGKQNALELYEKHAKPIFKLANIDVCVITTQRPNQIFDLVLEQHLDTFDGIITCGGDGTFSELFNGIIYKEMLKINPDNPLKIDMNSIPKPNKPLGIIPAGSTDSVAYCLHGTSDIKTCIIHIVLGQTTGVDISSVSNSDKGIIRFYASALSYGYLGDVLFDSENHRWLGPRRYEYSGFKKILSNRPYEVELSILQEYEKSDSDVIVNCDDKFKNHKCYENCEKCSLKNDDQNSMTDEEEKYRKVTAKVSMVMGVNMSCACDRSPSGPSPFLHIGDGYVDVVVVRHGSVWNILKLLMTLSQEDGDISTLPFVEVFRTRKFHMKVLNGTSVGTLTDSTQPISMPSRNCSVWNCDGEILQEPEITVRCHRQLINVFRRGAASMNSDASSGYCCL